MTKQPKPRSTPRLPVREAERRAALIAQGPARDPAAAAHAHADPAGRLTN